MDERTLQALSKALTLLVFRNGTVETLHATSACLDDDTMRELNRDVNNRIYTVLTVCFNGTDEDINRLERSLNFLAKFYGHNWDPAKTVDILM